MCPPVFVIFNVSSTHHTCISRHYSAIVVFLRCFGSLKGNISMAFKKLSKWRSEHLGTTWTTGEELSKKLGINHKLKILQWVGRNSLSQEMRELQVQGYYTHIIPLQKLFIVVNQTVYFQVFLLHHWCCLT